MYEEKFLKIANEMLKHEEVCFEYKGYYICIQERFSDNGYEGDVFESEESLLSGEDCLDGGICESIVPIVAIYFFKEVADELIKNGEETC